MSRSRLTLQKTGDFEWNQTDQSLVLGSFFYGYVASQFFGGWLTKRFGGKWIFAIGTFIEAILALFSPWAAKSGTRIYIILRIIQGLGEVRLASEIKCCCS